MNQTSGKCENGNDKLTAVKTLDYLEDYTGITISRQKNKPQRDIDYPGYKSILRSTRYSKEHFIKDLEEMLQKKAHPTRSFER